SCPRCSSVAGALAGMGVFTRTAGYAGRGVSLTGASPSLQFREADESARAHMEAKPLVFQRLNSLLSGPLSPNVKDSIRSAPPPPAVSFPRGPAAGHSG